MEIRRGMGGWRVRRGGCRMRRGEDGGTQKVLNGRVPGEEWACTERGSEPAAVPAALPGGCIHPPLAAAVPGGAAARSQGCDSRPRGCDSRSRGCDSRSGPALPCPGGAAAALLLLWGTSGRGRRQRRFTMREDRA